MEFETFSSQKSCRKLIYTKVYLLEISLYITYALHDRFVN